MHLLWIDKNILITEKENKNSPVSRFPIIVSSPNLAVFHADSAPLIVPTLSSPRKSHDLVVCSFLPWFKNTDNTFGFSASEKTNPFSGKKRRRRRRKIEPSVLSP